MMQPRMQETATGDAPGVAFNRFAIPAASLTGDLVARRSLPAAASAPVRLDDGSLAHGKKRLSGLVQRVLVGLWAWGPWVGLASLVLLPPLGMTGLWIRERWRWAFSDIRRFLILRSRRHVVQDLLAEQRRLGAELEALFEAWDSGLVH